IIIDGKLLRGVSGTAGELGHMTIDWRGGRCNCGNNGCLEYLASGTAIARCANEAIASGHGAELLAFVQTLERHNATGLDGPASLPQRGASLGENDYNAASGLHSIDARIVAQAAEAGVPL